MALYLPTHKIRPEHLARRALIYVRQSSLAQVLKNIGSKARQYNLVQRALDLGWTEEQIVVVEHLRPFVGYPRPGILSVDFEVVAATGTESELLAGFFRRHDRASWLAWPAAGARLRGGESRRGRCRFAVRTAGPWPACGG